MGIIKHGNAGLLGVVVTTAGNDLLHTLPLSQAGVPFGANRSAVIRKIMCYNPNGANQTLQFGTLNRAAAPAFVQLLPTLVAVGLMDNEWTEDEIPYFEFISWPQATAAGRTGDIYVLASLAGLLVSIEVEENGA